MSMRHRFAGFKGTYRGLILAVALSGFACGSPERVNVVLFVVDDLGWADTGVYGSRFYETPNIDRLINNSVRFTNFYAASPVCSPTRASLMAGKHPARLKITNWIGGEQNGRLLQADYRRELPLEEVTIAERFRDAGYVTGFVGKWHLGSEGYLPQQQGFDINVGGHAAGQPGSYFYPYKHPNNAFWDVPDLEDGAEGEYLTDRLAAESIRFISDNAGKPFFLVHSFYSVHTPLQAKQGMIESYRGKVADLGAPDCPAEAFSKESGRAVTKRCQDHPVYASMVQSTDEAVGRILNALERLGIAERTAVLFVSDNGGLSTLPEGSTFMPTSNNPLRAGKGWLYEGGIRVPFSVRWPGISAAGAVRDEPASTIDIYATLEELAGIPHRIDDPGDGMSLAALIRGGPDPPARTLFWHFPHYHGSANRPSGAVRAGRYKLLEWYEDGQVELYDLEEDPSEQRNIADQNPDIAENMRARLHAWIEQAGAEMPKQNPDWAED